MAERELSILVRAKGALQAARDIGKVDSSVSNLGRTAATGLRTAGRNAAIIGAGIAAGVGAAVHSGIQSLAELEDSVSAVEGAISQAGISGAVSGKQIADWANEIESSVQAAFDDKAIVQATATLIRFGKVTPTNLRPAMEVITDLAVRTGDVESAAELLGKALADPTKAAGKLARMGIVLTKSQQDQIKAFEKAGDRAKAQEVILDSLAETTKGAAAASAGPYRDALNILTDVSEDARKALATGFLPVITKVAALLSSELAKPSTIAALKDFGTTLASGLNDLIEIARNLPWSAIADAMKLAGSGARAVLDAFRSLPPWVQTAVLTGWGLNKLTGGALGSIVGQLASGLIKGILGITAGVVNINAAVVNGAGGIPGAAAGKGGLLGRAGGALAAGGLGVIGAGVAVAAIGQAVQEGVGAAFNSKKDVLGIKGELRATGFFDLPAMIGNIGVAAELINTSLNRPPKVPQVLNDIAYRTQRLGEITAGKSDAITRSVNTTNAKLEQLRNARPRVTVNVNNRISFSAFLRTGTTRAALTGRVSGVV